jgi:hypothetical protein
MLVKEAPRGPEASRETAQRCTASAAIHSLASQATVTGASRSLSRRDETGTFYFFKVAWSLGLNGGRKKVMEAPDRRPRGNSECPHFLVLFACRT